VPVDVALDERDGTRRSGPWRGRPRYPRATSTHALAKASAARLQLTLPST
jgi:hypothetical protein